MHAILGARNDTCCHNLPESVMIVTSFRQFKCFPVKNRTHFENNLAELFMEGFVCYKTMLRSLNLAVHYMLY